MNINDLKNYPVFQRMSPVKKSVISEVIKHASAELSGKQGNVKIEKLLPFVMQANAKLKSAGEAFTNEESLLMIDFLSSDMSPEDKAKLEIIKKFIMK